MGREVDGELVGDMIRLTKEFEVGTDELTAEQMRAIAKERIADWTKELFDAGYTKIEPGIDLEIVTPFDMDPRYVVFRATLTASKDG